MSHGEILAHLLAEEHGRLLIAEQERAQLAARLERAEARIAELEHSPTGEPAPR